MTAMSIPAGTGRPFTVADLEGMPDDGRRYELIDGELLVSPAPGLAHQEVVYTLYGVLRAACPRDLWVIGAPFAVRPDTFNELQPDILVARNADLTLKDLPAAPLLAVEVISPSSRLIDASLKKAAYARLGVPSFWLIDPDPENPQLTVFEIDSAGDYRQAGQATGEQAYQARRPFAVRVVPADLVARLRP